MHLSKLRITSIVVVTLLGVSVLLYVGVTHPRTPVPRTQGTHTPAIIHPVRLEIPRIHVDARVEDVGVTSSGAMEAPEGPADIAWYRGGPVPGDIGSAVMAGHYGWKGGKAAAFDRLSALKKGDLLTVTNESGTRITFIVTRTQVLGANANAADVFISSQGRHLNLITCGGVWDRGLKSYSERLVVFTDLVEQ